MQVQAAAREIRHGALSLIASYDGDWRMLVSPLLFIRPLHLSHGRVSKKLPFFHKVHLFYSSVHSPHSSPLF